LVDAMQRDRSPTDRRCTDWRPFTLLFSGHLIVSVIYTLALGLDIEANPRARPWDWFWQAIPADLLRTQALSSLWHLHSQPPLFNAYGALFFKLSAEHPLQWMQAVNVLLGSAVSGMMYSIVFSLTRHHRLSLAAGFVLLLNPALYLYEAFILYGVFSAFLVASSAYLFARYQLTGRDGYLTAFVVAVNLMVLTRSVYHLVFLAVAVALVAVVARRRVKRQLVLALLVSNLSIGWYAKNYVMFGFCGSSSWMGANLWKIASAGYSRDELVALAKRVPIPNQAIEVPVFSPPSAYRIAALIARPDGDVLSRDDRHNREYIGIARLYFDASMVLIRDDTGRYLRNVRRAYDDFARPSSGYVQLSVNASKIGWHEWVSSQIVQGLLPAERLGIRPFAFYLLPAALAVFLIGGVRAAGLRPARWRALARRHGAALFLWLLLAYTTAVCVMLDYGENHRLKFIVEQPMWAFIVGAAYLGVRWIRAHAAMVERGGRAGGRVGG
jgi:4-amino-4-deoxy-L-arabinose transferase-like glycosyltransferase